MKHIGQHIFILLASCACIFASCGRDDAEVIPRGTLAKIYADMFVTDQWTTSSPDIRRIADTTLVYEPILEKYGYTSADYRKSVDVYMDDPERFAKILRTSVEILDERLKKLKRLQASLKTEEERAAERAALLEAVKSDFRPEEFFPYMFDEPYVHYYDSVSFEPDSALQIYRLTPIERADTIYDRLQMIIIRDSLSVTDSLSAADTLATGDSIAVPDVPIAVDSVSDGRLKTMARPRDILNRNRIRK